jgi:hypothetical protein
METANEFLIRKGIRKVYQPAQRYSLTIAEIVEFLDEYASRAVNDFVEIKNQENKKPVEAFRVNR